MSAGDVSKIIKLLQLTQSPNDHEALSAVRKANELIRADNGSWERFFGFMETRPKQQSDNGIDLLDEWYCTKPLDQIQLLNKACDLSKPPYDAMCKSIREMWKTRNGFLSDKQILCIMRAIKFNS